MRTFTLLYLKKFEFSRGYLDSRWEAFWILTRYSKDNSREISDAKYLI